MDWRLKCLTFHVLGAFPGGARIHRALQRHVTGRYLLNIPSGSLGVHRNHVANYQRLGHAGRALEFGAGPHLLTALMLSAAGAREIFAIDIERLATPERVNHVIRRLRELQVTGDWIEVRNLDDDLLQKYRIRYLAPGDARSTGLEDGSIDFFYSTSTLEHISEPDIAAILRECARVASPQALMSFAIGYWDHYSRFDRSISRSNFYRYSDRQWAKYNPPHHFQNRLRHSDFERLFADLGLRVISARRQDRGDSREIDGLRLADRFRRYSRDDLLTHNGHFLLSPGDAVAHASRG
jgi:SAM-dependent methyltransferase